MSNLLDHASCLEAGEIKKDEDLLIDFHLGNAINLDIIEKLVTGSWTKYNLYVPRYYRGEFEKLKTFAPKATRFEVGFLEGTSDLLSLPSQPAKLSPFVYKDIVPIVKQGLKDRNIQIPLVEYGEKICQHQILVKGLYERVFRRILRAISTLSEIQRGGTRQIYEDVDVCGKFVQVELWEDDIPTTLIVGRNISGLYMPSKQVLYVGNYDSVLLLMDTLGQRICLEVGCQVTKISNTPGTISNDLSNQILLVGDQILREAGNDGYEIIALFEATVISVVLKNHPDKVNDCEEFFRNCLNELNGICLHQKWARNVLRLWTKMIKVFELCAPEVLSNIFCVYRIWGHPRVNILDGMQKVFDKGTQKKIRIGTSSKLALCQFRKMFLNAYLGKKSHYPNMEIPLDNKYVYDRLRKHLPIDKNAPGYSIWDFESITINQIWELPETYDVCHILNDKAVSPNISELHESISQGRGTQAGVVRRGIIRWLKGESIRCKEFLQKVNDQGLDEDSLIIGMYEKEREIKVKARMFSLMSAEMRMYFVLTEELIANHVLPLFPEITMKDPLHVQIRKIWNVAGKNNGELNPNINIDFEKWNLNMRHEFTSGIFQQIDQMFGYQNLILRTHEIFESSFIYSSSGKYLPKINDDHILIDEPMAYTGHLGGFEGLRQKGWTIATVCLLAYIADEMGIEMSLLGQGDNQVLKLYMPQGKWKGLCYSEEAQIEDAKRITNEYVRQMELRFHDAGLPIKMRETWRSCRLFMYGKNMYLDGNNLPQWSKKLLRSYALSNEGSITISGVVGTIATNMSAAAGVSVHPDIMYILYLIMAEWSLEYLLSYHPFTRTSLKYNCQYNVRIPGHRKSLKTLHPNYKRIIATLLTVPTSVGGNVTIPITSFIVRGFPDHATEAYSWIKLLKNVPSDYQSLYQNWYSFIQNLTMEEDMLIQSPWSLNHLKPPTPGMQSRDIIRDWILSGQFHQNKFLKNMTPINETFDRKAICKELLTDPINPLISYEIYQAFPQSYFDSILRRFEGTRSVKKLAMKEGDRRPVVKKLMEVEENYLYYLIWRAEQSGVVYSECATEHVRQCRNIGWGRIINGITTPHPIEFAFDEVCHGSNKDCSGTDYIYARVDVNGDFPPYLGSKVKTKVISQQDEGARLEPLICTSARIARYLKWLNLGDNIINVVLQCARSICNLDIYDKFFDDDPHSEMFSGSVEHRFNPSAASEGCFVNYSPQIGKKVFLSSDNMPTFGKGRQNFTLHFQALFALIQYVVAVLKLSGSFHFHLKCKTCIVPVCEDIGDISSHHPNIDKAFSERIIPILRETLGYITEKVIPEKKTEMVRIPGAVIQMSDTPGFRRDTYYGVLLTVSAKCALSLFYKGSKSAEGLGSDDLQSFPRVYAYKLYSDHVIWMVSRILVYLQAIHNEMIPNAQNLTVIKQRMSRVLAHSTLSKYKEVASLCIGRNVSKIPWSEVGTLNSGNYPDNIESFLRCTKMALIREVDRVAGFDNRISSSVIIPMLSCSVKEHQTIIGYICMMKYQCWDCMSLPTKPTDEDYADCRFKHIQKQIRRVILIQAPLDRAVKLMSVKSHKITPRELYVPSCGKNIRIYTSRYHLDMRAEVRFPKRREALFRRKITLPTQSIYKWTDVLNFCGLEPSAVIVFGDGTGATSYASARRWISSTVFPCSYLEGKKMIPQDLTSMRPMLSRNFINVSGRLQEEIPDDIMDPSWSKEFNKSLVNMPDDVLIIADLEGPDGNLALVLNLLKSLRPSQNVIVKVYWADIVNLNERMKLTDVSIYISPQGNLHSGEMFIIGKTTSVDVLLSWRRDQASIQQEIFRISEEDTIKSTEEIEDKCEWLQTVSRNIAEDHLLSKFINLGRQLWSESPFKIIASLVNHINSRYRFPQDKIRRHDTRNLVDGVLDRLVAGVKIVLLSIFGQDILDKEWFNSLYLVRCSKFNRYRPLSHLKIIFSDDRPDRVVLSDKDILSGQCLYHNISTHLVCPESLEGFYAYIVVPAVNGYEDIMISNLVSDVNDMVEDLSDLSGQTNESC
ncbi:TPA_asm: polyprotein [Ranunculus virus 1]|uniref:Replicase n=1 Tax=Ranunculus virus 1 TaxID=2977983 RepID=A0A9N6YIX8_9RHAB|nr:TPA_asm: polyprotein [Ranunculus virus 1]